MDMNPQISNVHDDDEDVDETLLERFQALGEMFPDKMRSVVDQSFNWSLWAASNTGKLLSNIMWIVSTSSLIMIVPYVVEKERSDVAKNQMAQQRQMLLGPNQAMSKIKSSQF